ncbi:MAG: hypothetical protein KDN22_00055 [Verrucomicrobiae bacterium]|nr:hypothetical protein [Verrucomicrobiae bacterium]
MLRSRARIPGLCAIVPLLAGCSGERSDPPAVAATESKKLADSGAAPRVKAAMEIELLAEGSQHWQVVKTIAGNAGVEFTEDGVCRILDGEPISAIRYEGPWELPVTNYEIVYEARRVDGPDFFAALTFPVNSLGSCATFVPGGWGGSVTGISCIDDIDASANETTSTYTYPAGEWFTFRIEVRPDVLKVWNGSAIIVKAPLAGKKISLRHGDIEECAPFGLSTYMTVGEVRKIVIRSLDGKPLWKRSLE